MSTVIKINNPILIQHICATAHAIKDKIEQVWIDEKAAAEKVRLSTNFLKRWFNYKDNGCRDAYTIGLYLYHKFQHRALMELCSPLPRNVLYLPESTCKYLYMTDLWDKTTKTIRK